MCNYLVAQNSFENKCYIIELQLYNIMSLQTCYFLKFNRKRSLKDLYSVNPFIRTILITPYH